MNPTAISAAIAAQAGVSAEDTVKAGAKTKFESEFEKCSLIIEAVLNGTSITNHVVIGLAIISSIAEHVEPKTRIAILNSLDKLKTDIIAMGVEKSADIEVKGFDTQAT